MDNYLQEGIAAAKAGDKSRAFDLLGSLPPKSLPLLSRHGCGCPVSYRMTLSVCIV